MATYAAIADYVKKSAGWTPKTCWIAHCKELNGLPVKKAPILSGAARMVPCARRSRPMRKPFPVDVRGGA